MPAEIADLECSCGACLKDHSSIGFPYVIDLYTIAPKFRSPSATVDLLTLNASGAPGAISFLPNSLLAFFSDHDSGLGDAHGGSLEYGVFKLCESVLKMA